MTDDETTAFLERFGRALLENDTAFLRERTTPETTFVFRGSEAGREETLTDMDGEGDEDRVVRRETDAVVVGDSAGALFTTVEFDVEEFMGIESSGRYTTKSGLYVEFEDRVVTHVRGVENREEMLAAFGFLTESMSGGYLAADLVADKIRQEYREVLMRVLRHNIRNEADVIGAVADQLSDRAPETELLRAAVERLTRAATKARRVEQEVLRPELTREPVAVVSSVETVVAEVASEIGGDGPDPTSMIERLPDAPETVQTDPRLFRAAVRELVENAVRHAGEPTPDVEVRIAPAEPTQYALDLVVADDGPGIPDSEVVPVRRERETDLHHSTGLGLWLVKWCVERLEGDVRFETPPEGGTRVHLLFPES
ncbi:MAG: sensor histidine kinase [Halobaculum sp.]